MTIDTDYALLRRKMVDSQIRTTDVTEHRIIAAFLDVPREEFVPSARRPLAYIDEDIQTVGAAEGGPRWLMEPSPFAKLLQLADIGPDDVVLDVGCGTGYSSAVISRLAGAVIALESTPELAERAMERLAENGYETVAVVSGPLTEGHAGEGPYDLIFVNGAVDSVPSVLFEQLKDGGRLVAVVGSGNSGRATRFVKEGGRISGRAAFNCAIKRLAGFERKPEFVF